MGLSVRPLSIVYLCNPKNLPCFPFELLFFFDVGLVVPSARGTRSPSHPPLIPGGGGGAE